RSSPPEEITKVAPIAMIPMNVALVRTLVTLVGDRKSGLIRTPTTVRTTRAMNGPRSIQLIRLSSGSCWGTAIVSVTSCFLPRLGRAAITGRGENDCVFGDLLSDKLAGDLAAPHDQNTVAQTNQFLEFGRNHYACL